MAWEPVVSRGHEARPRARPAMLAIFCLFALGPVVLVAQDLVEGRWGEPYPALILPAFRGAPGAREVTTSRPLFDVRFADGRTRRYRPARLFGETPAAPMFLARHAFSEGLDAEGRPGADFHQRPSRFSRRGFLRSPPPGRTWEGTPRARDPRTVRWLRQRLERLAPGAVPVELTVTWVRTRYALPSGSIVDETVEQRVVVALGGQGW